MLLIAIIVERTVTPSVAKSFHLVRKC